MEQATSVAHDRLTTCAVPSLRIVTVTESAKQERADRVTYDLPSSGEGLAWGRAVHRSLEALGRGRKGDSLRAFLTAVARDEGLTDEQGSALARQVAEIELSASWQSLIASGDAHFELSVMLSSHEGDVEIIREGVIDAAAHVGKTWEVIDWKTDAVTDEVWTHREVQYTRQAERYGSILSAITGAGASARIERVRLSGAENPESANG